MKNWSIPSSNFALKTSNNNKMKTKTLMGNLWFHGWEQLSSSVAIIFFDDFQVSYSILNFNAPNIMVDSGFSPVLLLDLLCCVGIWKNCSLIYINKKHWSIREKKFWFFGGELWHTSAPKEIRRWPSHPVLCLEPAL